MLLPRMQVGCAVRLVIALGAVLALLVPGEAGAATVHVGRAPANPYPCCLFEGYSKADRAAYFEAKPGERNDVIVTHDQAKVIFHDRGAPVQAGEGCEQVDERTSSCSEVAFVQVKLGNEDDILQGAEAQGVSSELGAMRAFGGRGDDALFGGPGRDELDGGGGGHDRLFGEDGNDVLSDGDRSGVAGGPHPGGDVMDGGRDTDMLSYAQRSGPVDVRLGLGALVGEPGEDDETRNFEAVLGGAGNDRLIGDSGFNYLYGRAGDDELRGLAGDDILDGGDGADRLFGGSEYDALFPGPGLDRLSCGGYTDDVYSPEASERLSDCEWVRFVPPPGDETWNSFRFLPFAQRVSAGFVDFALTCPQLDNGEDFEIQPCAGTLSLRTAYGRHKLLGFARKADRDPTDVRVKLTPAGRRLIHRPRGVIATVSLRGAPTAGIPWPAVAWTIRVAG